MATRRLVAVLLCLGLAAASCSSDDDDAATPSQFVEPLADLGLPTYPYVDGGNTAGSTIPLADYEMAFGYAQAPLCGYLGDPANQPSEVDQCIGLVESPPDSTPYEALLPSETESGVSDKCAHPTAYVPTLVAVIANPSEAIPAGWVELVVPGEIGSPDFEAIQYQPPNGVQLFSVLGDPIDEIIDAGLPPGEAAPVYRTFPAPKWKYGPGDVAVPASSTLLVGSGQMAESGGTVAIIDEFGSDNTDYNGSHGEFIAGLVKRVNPAANIVTVDRGAIYKQNLIEGEVQLSVAIQLALGGSAQGYLDDGLAPTPTTINLSLGTYPCIVGGDEYTPVYLAEELQSWTEAGFDVATVAAAGNDSHGANGPPFYPAAFDFVLGVGALAWNGTDWVAADYSNVIGADIWAPGTALISDHRQYGLAQWSGTSFASAIVSALEADR